jgi:hypothetical protein
VAELRRALETAELRRESLERDVAALRAAAGQTREDMAATREQLEDARRQMESLRQGKDTAVAKAAAAAMVSGQASTWGVGWARVRRVRLGGWWLWWLDLSQCSAPR